MTDVPGTEPPEPDMTAAEYALGVLTGADLSAAREWQRSDADFRAEVARWSGRLAPMLDTIDPVAPPTSVWRLIQQRIALSAASGNIVQLRRRASRWRNLAGGMTAIAASLGLFILLRPAPPPPTEQIQRPVTTPLVAALGDKENGTKVVASWDGGVRQLVLVVSGQLPTDPARSRELWVIPKGAKPVSLGTMATAKQMHLQIADARARLLQRGATIAITIEPPGGSPSGAPTGPVFASGELTRA